MITIVFLIVAAIFKSIFDTLQFHYENSVFSKTSQKWWNPAISWKNKWKNDDPNQGERFFGSSTFLVCITDAWHFFQHLMIFCIVLSIVTYVQIYNIWIDFFICYAIFTGVFELFFSKIFHKK